MKRIGRAERWPLIFAHQILLLRSDDVCTRARTKVILGCRKMSTLETVARLETLLKFFKI